MTLYNSEPEIALRQALRDHFKKKYRTMEHAAGFVGCTPEWLGKVLRGVGWPSEAMLADAGIEVTVTRQVEWKRI